MVDLVLVQADRLDQVDLDLVAGGEAADQVGTAGRPQCCATARIGGMLSPGCEYSAARKVSWKSSSRTATPLAHAAHSGENVPSTPNTVAPGGVRGGPAPGARAFDDRTAGQRGGGDRGVVDDAVDDHLGDVVADLHRVGGHLGDLPGEVLVPGESLRRTDECVRDVISLESSERWCFDLHAYADVDKVGNALHMPIFAKCIEQICECCVCRRC